MSFHRGASSLHCFHFPKCEFNKPLEKRKSHPGMYLLHACFMVPGMTQVCIFTMWRLREMHPFWERDMRKQVPHLQHYVTEPWPQSMSKYKTFQLKYKLKKKTKKPKQPKEDQVKECFMLQRLCTINSGNTVGNNDQQILITEYCTSCFLCSAQLSLLYAVPYSTKILLLPGYNYYKLTN